nr:leukotriene B4 receptor 1-like [Nothobranchius furzeri]XP_054604277.1 leukotriene B4 receptor 1-like [Nothobranchius furzeri]
MDQPNSTMATFNFTSSAGPHPSWDSSGLVPAVMLSLVCVLGVPGNIAVIILKPNFARMSSLSQSLLLNLAISDLLCLMTLPPWIYAFLYGWHFGVVACKLLAYVECCTIYGSLLTVTGLGIQRYLVVVHRQSCQQTGLLLALLWLVSFTLSTPSLVTRSVKNQLWPDCQDQYSSDSQQIASLMTETTFGFLSFIIVAFSYIQIKRTVNQSAFFKYPQTTRLVTSIIVSLFVLWAPYHIVNILGVVAICLKNESLLKFYKDTKNIVGSVTFTNSFLNPFLYAFASGKISMSCRKHKPVTQMETISQVTEVSTVAELCQ